MGEARQITMDVRPIVAGGQEPFAAIMTAIQTLTSPGDQLIITTPFEPAPLYRVMEREGFEHVSVPLEDGAYQVRFTRR